MKIEKFGIFLKRKKITVSIATEDRLVLLMEMEMIKCCNYLLKHILATQI
jgi:hypothetical protein